ncbi:MAG: YitT family protein [Thermincolia bacterium]
MSIKVFREYMGVLLGVIITAVGLDMFLIPNKIAAGGVSGIATIAYYLSEFPVGMTMLAINIPLFIFSIKQMGLGFGIRSLFGTVTLSLAVDLMAKFLPVPTTDIFLASLYGGVVVGIGLGIVFRSKGTTGGTDLAAALIHRFTGLPIGMSLLAIDACVIVAAGVFFNAEAAMFALITVFVTARVIDMVQEGVGYAKAALIISDHNDRIAEVILHQMDRGATALRGRGLYTRREKDILLSIVTQSEVSRLKEMVYAVDPKAFVIVANIHEVLGEGFRKFR